MQNKKKITILIIDDHSIIEIDFDKIFEEDHFNVYYADGIENGLEIAERYIPDVIICSISSLENGKKLIKNILSQENINVVPILYVSSDVVNNDFREIMNAGAADYFSKDFYPEDLVQSVKIRIAKNIALKTQLMEICRRTFEIENSPKKDHILITVGKKLQLIKFEKIICITAEKEYSKIRTSNGKSIVVRKSLNNWLDCLPPRDFLRIHRQSIINLNYIERIEKLKLRTYVVYLKLLPKPLELSRRYSSLMRKEFSEYI